MNILVVFFAAIVSVFLPLSASGQAGYVLDGNGTWVLNGNISLTQLSNLPPGGSIRRLSRADNDFIILANPTGTKTAELRCWEQDCSRGLRVPSQRSTAYGALGSLIGAVVETGRSLLRSNRRPAAGLNRGTKLSEKVLSLKGEAIDLSPALNLEGQHYLRWRPVSQDENAEQSWTTPILLDKSLIVSGFQSGIYELNLMRSNGSNFEPLASVWVLVARPEGFEKANASFEKVREVTQSWGDNVRPEASRLFLQAALEHLASDAVKSDSDVPKKKPKF